MHSKIVRFPSRKLGRKAQEESQLNWIFILIVGAVIMAFFVFIVVKQRAASEAKFAGTVTRQLNTILIGAKVSSGTVQEIPTPELSIRFTCNDYYIGVASQRLGNRILFAPEFLEGDRLITWTMDWNVPFKVTSFLYLTSPLVRYIIVAQSETDRAALEIFNALPQKLNKRLISMGEYDSLSDAGDKYVRFIFVNPSGDTFAIPTALQNVLVSGLKVETEAHDLRFLVKSGTQLITSGAIKKYGEPEAMYGAIFTDKEDEYDCIMKRAYERLKMVAKVYYEKLNLIAPIYAQTGCEGFYRNNPYLDEIIGAVEVYPPGYSQIAEAKATLKEQNTRIQLQSCPLIY
jgi:hypothetical protein